MTITCSSCGVHNEDDALFCRRCGAAIGPDHGGAGWAAPPEQPQVPVPVGGPPRSPVPVAPLSGQAAEPLPAQPEGYQLSHRGRTYAVGYGPNFYGVWDLRTGGAPVAWFDRTPMGWEAAWRRFQDLDGGGGIPSWRRAQPGWVLLHILIGFGIWLAQLFMMGIVLAAVIGPERLQEIQDLPDEQAGSFGGAALLALAASLAGWLLFVYLRSSAKKRGWILAGVLGASFAILVAVGLAVVPA